MGTISVTWPSDGDTIDASDVSTPGNVIVNAINGNLDSNNISPGGLTPSNLVSGTGTSWAMQSYTPTLTNLTTASGTSVASYIQMGKIVFFQWTWTFGSGSSVSTGPTFTLPVAPTGMTAGLSNSITGMIRDVSAIQSYPSYADFSSGSTMTIKIAAASFSYVLSDNITSTAPFTWASGDLIQIGGHYPVA